MESRYTVQFIISDTYLIISTYNIYFSSDDLNTDQNPNTYVKHKRNETHGKVHRTVSSGVEKIFNIYQNPKISANAALSIYSSSDSNSSNTNSDNSSGKYKKR